jgi:hypothetical protein
MYFTVCNSTWFSLRFLGYLFDRISYHPIEEFLGMELESSDLFIYQTYKCFLKKHRIASTSIRGHCLTSVCLAQTDWPDLLLRKLF